MKGHMNHEHETKGGTSASNSAYDRVCPGRHQAQKGIPDKQGEWAEYGQLIHAALAENGRDGQVALPKLTPEQRDMFESVREIEKKVISQIFNGEPDSTNRVWREIRYWASVPDKWPDPETKFPHSGKADMVLRRKNTALVLDYKVLAGDVPDSPKNEQLRDLAVMVWRTLVGVDNVVVAIIQPLETWSPELCRYDETALKQAEQEMWERVRASNDPNAKRIAGDLQCKFCRAVGVCPENAAWKAALVPERDSPLTRAMALWTPEDRSRVAEHLPRLKTLLSQAEEHLKASLSADPESVPGFYLKPGAARKPINNPQELFNRFSAIGGQLEQFMQCVDVTKGEFEKRVRLVTKLKGKVLKTEVDKLLEGIVDENPVEPSLAKKKEA